MAKPSIMLGVNQTIMMAMGMVVIAAIVGVRGLGREVLDGCRLLDVGEALNAGIAIVAMAIVLDRVSYAWSLRATARLDRRSRVRRDVLPARGGHRCRRARGGRGVHRSAGAAAAGLPANWTVSVATPVEQGARLDPAHVRRGDQRRSANWPIKYALDPLRNLLIGVPWWIVAGVAALLAMAACPAGGDSPCSRRAASRRSASSGMWDDAMDTLSQVMVAVVVSVAIAIPLGIWSRAQRSVAAGAQADARRDADDAGVRVPRAGDRAVQVGRVPGVIAALVYALPPAIRLTDLGIRQVPTEIVEAARGVRSERIADCSGRCRCRSRVLRSCSA